MGRCWSLLFLAVPVLGTLAFIWPAANLWPMQNHWLPDNINVNGHVIDSLFMFILYLTGIIFIATGIAIVYCLWKYDAAKNPNPTVYSHGSHSLEVVWSIVPSAILLFIAIYQMSAWADAKLRKPDKDPIAAVTGRQFEWRIRYAGKDGKLYTRDDLQTVNDLHLPVDETVVIAIKSQDVLHSFFLPNLRVKQDVVPGMVQYVWFKANKTGRYDLVCAELCGWGHYKMKGRLTLESREKFDRWLENEFQSQEKAEFVVQTGDEDE